MQDIPLEEISMLSEEEASTQNTYEKLGVSNHCKLQSRDTLPVRHFFGEFKTDLGLSDSSHSPEETRAPRSIISTINKNLPRFVEYILPSSKQRTRIWFSRHRDLHLRFASIGREIIDNIVLGCNLWTILLLNNSL
jgi:hypothetical protein